MTTLKVLTIRSVLAGMLLQSILGVAEERTGLQPRPEQAWTSRSAKFTQTPLASPVASPVSPRVSMSRQKYYFHDVACSAESLQSDFTESQPLADSSARIQENPGERVEAMSRIQGTGPSIVPEMAPGGEIQ